MKIESKDVPLLPFENRAEKKSKTFEELAESLFEEPAPQGTPEPKNEPAPAAEAGEPVAEAAEPAEAEELEEVEEAPKAPERYKVKVAGVEQEVTLDEALKGYSRTEDYTRKTQAHAENVKAFEAERQATIAARNQYAERLEALHVALTELQPAEPNWDALQQENPEKFAQEFAAHQLRQRNLQKVEAERRRVAEEQMQQFQAQQAQALEIERQRLVEAIPEWKDEAKARAGKQELVEYVRSLGYPDEALAQVSDHRVLVAFRESMLYRNLVKKGTELRSTAVATPTLKAGAPSATARAASRKSAAQARRAQLARDGSVDSAARVFMDMLSD